MLLLYVLAIVQFTRKYQPILGYHDGGCIDMEKTREYMEKCPIWGDFSNFITQRRRGRRGRKV